MPFKRLELPSGDVLRANFRYDPETGLLYRRSNGKLAHLDTKPYLRVCFKKVYYKAHRIIWRMEVSEEVPEQIDHINENKTDNRLENFRAASHGDNQHNCRIYRNNTSGLKGVFWHQPAQKWQARIWVDGKGISLGLFATPGDAHAAYVEAAIKYRGEFANDGRGSIVLQQPQQPATPPMGGRAWGS